MIAAVRDGLAVSPRLAKQWSLPVLDDLRGRWTTSAAAYRWAFDNLWDRLNHHVIACSWPDALALRDYLVENKVFIFWLSGSLDGARAYSDANGELHMMEELFARGSHCPACGRHSRHDPGGTAGISAPVRAQLVLRCFAAAGGGWPAWR